MTRLAVTRCAAFAFAFAATIAASTAASAQSFYEDFSSGGAPLGRRFQFGFGGQVGGSGPIPRTVVSFPGSYAPGTIIISTSQRRLYFVTARGEAIRYGIGVGRDGFRWGGVH